MTLRLPQDAPIELHEALANAGFSILEIDGVLVCGDVPGAQAFVDSWTFDEVPLKPLNKSQFESLLALTGYDDLWGTLEANLKVSDVYFYAKLKGLRASETFEFDNVVRLVEQFSTVAPEASNVSIAQLPDVWRFVQSTF